MLDVREGPPDGGEPLRGHSIGGFDLGLERAGMRCVWQCEIDPFCQRVLAKHWPDVLRVPDVRDVNADTVPAVDVIAGGFPCQPVSHNGHGLVDADERWLWPEFRRVVCELRPRYVLLENVAALLGRGLPEILGELAQDGYDAEWTCLRAADAGAPHRRERLFVVAYAQCVGREAGPRVLTRELAKDLSQSPAWSGVLDRDPDGDLRLVPPPDVLRVADGLPDELDRLRAVGNAIVPQVAEAIGRRIVAYEQGELADAA